MLTKDDILQFKKSGEIAQTCLLEGAKLIKPGASLREVVDTIEERIKKMGAEIAFPAQISLNNIAAHYCPTTQKDIIFKEGDIAKLDIGAHIDGHIADNAITINLGAHDELTKASKEALLAAIKIIRPGITLGEIGKTIQETIQSHGYQPVRNLSGHGLGPYQIHTKPSIPNVDTKDNTELQEDQVIAIEPFATNGQGAIFESENPTIFTHIQNKPTRSQYARQLLQDIKGFEGLPFATRWLERKHGVGKTKLALQELMRNKSIIAHPPLPEVSGGLVSQHEHSIIVKEKPIIFTKLE